VAVRGAAVLAGEAAGDVTALRVRQWPATMQFSRDEFISLLIVYEVPDIAALKMHVARWRDEVESLPVRDACCVCAHGVRVSDRCVAMRSTAFGCFSTLCSIT
jgi:hypothetical protein